MPTPLIATPELPDYNYHNTPEFIQGILESMGGLPALLTFCQLNGVQVAIGADCQYHCHVRDEGIYAVELDALSALVMGVNRYLKIGKQTL